MLISAQEFARTHSCDQDWLALMAGEQVPTWKPGQRGTYSGFPATIRRHYQNGMWEVRVPGGEVCISASNFIPEQE